MKFLKTAEFNLLTAIFIFVVTIIGFASTSFLLTSQYIDIPLGFLYSGGILSILYFISHFFVILDEKKEFANFSIAAIGIRFAVMIATLIIAAMMYYRWDLKLFNIFVYIGVYTISTLFFVILHLIRRKE